MEGLIRSNPAHEPIPGLRQVLQYLVAPNWQFFAVAQGAVETAAALFLLAGLFSRVAALVAALIAIELALTVAFEVSDSGFQWMYYLAVVASLQVLVAGPGPLALDSLRKRR